MRDLRSFYLTSRQHFTQVVLFDFKCHSVLLVLSGLMLISVKEQLCYGNTFSLPSLNSDQPSHVEYDISAIQTEGIYFKGGNDSRDEK